MIELVALDDVKRALNVWEDDDDEILQLYIKASSKAVTNYLKGQVFKVLGDIGEDGQPVGLVPEEVQLATIMLVGFVYRNPDGNDSKEWEQGYLPRPVTALLYPLRDPAINGLTELPGYGLSGDDIIIEEGGIEEAPIDGKPYLRKDGTWVQEQISFSESIEYTFNNTTTAPPGAGQLRMNNADQTLATEFYASFTDAPGVDVSRFLKSINDSMTITVQDKDDATRWRRYAALAPPVIGANYVAIYVSYQAGAAAVPEQRAIMTVRGFIASDFVPQ